MTKSRKKLRSSNSLHGRDSKEMRFSAPLKLSQELKLLVSTHATALSTLKKTPNTLILLRPFVFSWIQPVRFQKAEQVNGTFIFKFLIYHVQSNTNALLLPVW